MTDKPESTPDDEVHVNAEGKRYIKAVNQTIHLEPQAFQMEGVFGDDSHLRHLLDDIPTRHVAFILRGPHSRTAHLGAWLGRILHRHIAWGLWKIRRYVGTGTVKNSKEKPIPEGTEFSVNMEMSGVALEKQVIGPDWFLDYVQQKWQEQEDDA